MIPKYFISAVGEFQNEYFRFHAFGPFRNITSHRAAALGARKCLYDYRQFSIFGIVSTHLEHLEILCGTVQPLTNGPVTNDPGTTAPRLDTRFANSPSWINRW